MNLRAIFAVLLGVLFAVVEASGQGRFIFNNGSTTAISNYAVWPPARASTNTKVAMYYSTNLSAPSYTFTLNTNAVTNLVSPGVFFGGTRSVPGVMGGTTIAVSIRAWSPPHATWEAAQNADSCGLEPMGESGVFVLTLASNNPAPPIVGNGFQTFALTAPETRICRALVGLSRQGDMMELRLSAPTGESPYVYRIYTSTTLLSNSWRLTNVTATGPVTVWNDPIGTNQTRFYSAYSWAWRYGGP